MGGRGVVGAWTPLGIIAIHGLDDGEQRLDISLICSVRVRLVPVGAICH